MRCPHRCFWLSLLCGINTYCGTAAATAETIARPADRQFILDHADLLSPGVERQLRQRCDQLLTDTGLPVAVLTIDSVANHDAGSNGPGGLELWVRHLFEDWSHKHPLQNGQDWDAGVLIVIAYDDQRARIEPGPTAAGITTQDTAAFAERILRPALRRGDAEAAVIATVAALDAQARGQASTLSLTQPKGYLIWIGITLLGGLCVLSLLRSGGSGVASWAGRKLLVLPGLALFHLTHQATEPTDPATEPIGVAGGW